MQIEYGACGGIDKPVHDGSPVVQPMMAPVLTIAAIAHFGGGAGGGVIR
jgi:hypothetical protein